MGVALCRNRVGVAQKSADDFQAETARNKVGRMGVSIIVKAVVVEAYLFCNAPPKLLDTLQRLVRVVAGEQISRRWRD